MSFAITSGLEILQVHESPLDIHVEKYWQDLKGKIIIIIKTFSLGTINIYFKY